MKNYHPFHILKAALWPLFISIELLLFFIFFLNLLSVVENPIELNNDIKINLITKYTYKCIFIIFLIIVTFLHGSEM